MSQTPDTLAARLAMLAAAGETYEDGARRLAHPDGFAAILEEIDMTVLPATLTFLNGSGEVALHVSGRRLHGILSPARAVSPDDADTIRAAAELLRDFAAAGPLRVRADAAPTGPDDQANSVSVAALAQAAGQVDPDTPLVEQARGRLGALMQAGLIVRGAAVQDAEGPEALVALLRGVAEGGLARFLTGRRESCGSHKDPSLTLVGGAAGEGAALGIAVLGDACLLCVVADADLARAHAALAPFLR
jgi:hypothetical protein